MHNELLHIGSITVYGYGLMIAVGIIAAYITAEHRAARLGLDPDRVFGIVCWAVVGGFIGAKLLYFITILPQIIEDPSLLYRDLTGGLVIYGGLIGGVIAIMLYCVRNRLNIFSYFDLAVPSVALAQGFGRIGCLLAGCCYGKETDSVFSITFTNSAYAPNGVALIPTQIISSILDFGHFFVLIYFAKHYKKREGQVCGVYFICYSIGRFILEFFRGDLERGSVGVLSTSQFISIFMLIFGIFLFFRPQKAVAAKDANPADGDNPVDEENPLQDDVPADEEAPTQDDVPADEEAPAQDEIPADEEAPTA